MNPRILAPLFALMLAAPAAAQKPGPVAAELFRGLDACVQSVLGADSLEAAAKRLGYGPQANGEGWVLRSGGNTYFLSQRVTSPGNGVMLTTCGVTGPLVADAEVAAELAERSRKAGLSIRPTRTNPDGGTVNTWMNTSGRGVLALSYIQQPAVRGNQPVTILTVVGR